VHPPIFLLILSVSAAEQLTQLLVLLQLRQCHLLAPVGLDGACLLLRQQQEHHVLLLVIRSLDVQVGSAAEVDSRVLSHWQASMWLYCHLLHLSFPLVITSPLRLLL
jgi:hypothetical protein